MAHPITTSGLAGGDVSTMHQSGQSTSDWVGAHNTAVSPETPDGDTLSTTWTSQAGDEEVKTTRNPSETDANFLRRHEAAYLLAMLDASPVP